MAKDDIERRFGKREHTQKLDDLSRRTRTTDDIEAEEEMLKNTEKVEPIKADKTPKRNDPCPCGSGKKFKKCCAKDA